MTGEQAAGAGPGPGLYLDLRALPPTPQRLFHIVDLVGARGFRKVALDWGSTFPWSLDERFRSAYSYPEEVVEGLGKRMAGLGMELLPVAPSPDSLDFVYRLAGYRHLFRFDRDPVALDLSAAGGLKLYCDLLEELVALPQGSRELALPESVFAPLQEWLEELEERGIRARALIVAESAYRARPDRAAVAEGGATETRQREGGEVASGASGGPLLALQQPPGAPPLRRSPELALDLVTIGAGPAQADAPALSADAAGEGRRIRALADRLEELAERGWTEIRAIREALVLSALSAAGETADPERRLERLKGHLEGAEQTAGELRSLLDARIEREPLEAALGSVFEPLREELHLLIPRVHLLERRAGRS